MDHLSYSSVFKIPQITSRGNKTVGEQILSCHRVFCKDIEQKPSRILAIRSQSLQFIVGG